MNSKLYETQELFKVLSNEVRLCILINLCKCGELKVSDLQNCASSSQSFVSQQLSSLKKQRIISSRKIGLEVYYKVIDARVCEIVNKLDLVSVCNVLEGSNERN